MKGGGNGGGGGFDQFGVFALDGRGRRVKTEERGWTGRETCRDS